ncbi:hypothetical protein CF642_38685, partial [Burkholderia pseudomallei]
MVPLWPLACCADRPDPGRPRRPLAARPLSLPAPREGLIAAVHGRSVRIDEALSWDYHTAVHGLMPIVRTDAWTGTESQNCPRQRYQS